MASGAGASAGAGAGAGAGALVDTSDTSAIDNSAGWALAANAFATWRAANIKVPTFVRAADGKMQITYAPEQDTQFKRYSWVHSMRVDDAAGDGKRVLQLKCMIEGCTKTPPWSTIAKEDGKPEIDFSNPMAHLRGQHDGVVVAADLNKKSAGAKKARASDDADVGGRKVYSEEEEREIVAELILAGGMPLSLVDSPWWREFCGKYNIHTFSRRTLGRVVEELTEKHVTTPTNNFISSVLEPMSIFVMGTPVLFKRKFFVGNDGVEDRAGRSLESFTLAGAIVTMPSLGEPAMLLPRVIALSLKHWQLEWDSTGGVATYDAESHAAFVIERLREKRIETADVLSLVLDTTNGNPSMTRSPLFANAGLANLELTPEEEKNPEKVRLWTRKAGVGYVPCDQHKESRVGVDMLGEPQFADVFEAALAMAKWVRVSDKHRNRFLEVQADMVKAELLPKNWKAVVPFVYPETRFLFALIALARILRLLVVFKYIYDKSLFGKLILDDGHSNETAVTYAEHFIKLDRFSVELDAICALFEPLVRLSARMGSTRRYTTSLPSVLFDDLFGKSQEFVSAFPGKAERIKGVVARYQSSLFERLASPALIEAARHPRRAKGPGDSVVTLPPIMPPKCAFFKAVDWDNYKNRSTHYIEKLNASDLSNSAAWLDPACADVFPRIMGHEGDAKVYCLRLLKASIVLELDGDVDSAEPVPALGRVASKSAKELARKLQTEYAEGLAKIDSDLQPWNVQPEMWASMQAKKKEELRTRLNGQGARIGSDQKPTPAPQGTSWSPQKLESSIREALEVEATTFQQLRAGFKTAKFGEPLADDFVRARYEWWPAHKSQLPLLYFCASVILGGMTATTENERFHSVIGYVMNKLRSRLTADSLERLALSKYMLVKKLEASAAFKTARTAEDMLEAGEEIFGEAFE